MKKKELINDSTQVNYYRVEKAIRYLAANFKEQPSLERIAQEIHLSPFHFQRIFLDWVGITPKKFLQYLSVEYLKKKIGGTQNVMAAADITGLSSQSRVYDLFVKIESVTPQEYKSGGKGITIRYGFHPSPFGLVFIALAGEGICDLHFVNDVKPEEVYENFSQQWTSAKLVEDTGYTQTYIDVIFKYNNSQPLQLLLQGTPFQLKVWEALINIPFGDVQSYEELADTINCPSARAVAHAAGLNPVSFLVPCHRIICKDGSVGKFHKGKVRKQLMLAWEMVQCAEQEKEQLAIA
jgi:AraC family transcriptional regulator of adaptative response/methylated-DNA-[protein]-cysteine methyltransferase